MPYIPQEKRTIIDDKMKNITDHILHKDTTTSIGEINYIITSLLNSYINKKQFNYDLCNNIIGVLECAKQELYRRVVAEYEDYKIQENGDVYTR